MKVVEKSTNDAIASNEINATLNEAEAIINQINESDIKKRKSKIFIIIALVLLFILALVFSTIFAILNMNSNKIVNGISIYGVDVSGLTPQEAKTKLTNYIDEKSEKRIRVTHDDFSATVSLVELNIIFDIDSAVADAYYVGRDKNIFENNFQIFHTMISKKDILPKVDCDLETFQSLINSINQNLPDSYLDSSYYVDGNELYIVNYKDGVTTDAKNLLARMLNSFTQSLEDEIVIDVPVINVKGKRVNIDEIYKEVHTEAKDAYFTTDPYTFYASSNGVDFDISLEEAKAMIGEYQEQYVIPLKTVYPNVSTSDIGMEAFPDLLSDFSTSFKTSNSNRSTNIALAASKLDGLVLMPGEELSYNQTIGQRTKSAGYKEAPAYLNGQVVQEVGGGICQVSSTLYNAVLYANLEVTERKNHSFKPTYVKPGLDATVSWGGPDLKFKNNRDYPIKIVTDTSGKIIHIYIYGLKTSSDPVVKLEATYLSTISPKTVYKKTSSLEPGEERTVSKGSAGCKTVTYKYLYDQDDNLISKEKISSDIYIAHDTVVEVGN